MPWPPPDRERLDSNGRAGGCELEGPIGPVHELLPAAASQAVEHATLTDQGGDVGVALDVDEVPSPHQPALGLGRATAHDREVSQRGVAQRRFAQALHLGDGRGGAQRVPGSDERVERTREPVLAHGDFGGHPGRAGQQVGDGRPLPRLCPLLSQRIELIGEIGVGQWCRGDQVGQTRHRICDELGGPAMQLGLSDPTQRTEDGRRDHRVTRPHDGHAELSHHRDEAGVHELIEGRQWLIEARHGRRERHRTPVEDSDHFGQFTRVRGQGSQPLHHVGCDVGGCWEGGVEVIPELGRELAHERDGRPGPALREAAQPHRQRMKRDPDTGREQLDRGGREGRHHDDLVRPIEHCRRPAGRVGHSGRGGTQHENGRLVVVSHSS